jgi:hypothetical protein
MLNTNDPAVPSPESNPLPPKRQLRRGNSALEHEDVEPWPEAIILFALLDDLASIIKRFVVLPDLAAEALALWVVHTYCFELRDITAYLGLESPEKRCGKTTLLSVLSELVNRPVIAANISPPALFRVIEEASPTLLIDEADTFLQGNDEMRGILNSGYTRKTAYVVRVAPDTARPQTRTSEGAGPGTTAEESSSRLIRFSSWCPKVMAAIGRLPETLADRCIRIRMERKTPGEACERLRNLDADNLRRRCARFVLDHAREISELRPEIPAELNDRAADIWEPLLVIADLAQNHWPGLARKASIRLSAPAQEITPIASLVLEILAVSCIRKSDKVFSRDIIQRLNLRLDRPWAELRKGRLVDELWLSGQLRRYGVRPKSMRLNGTTGRGYHMADFQPVMSRYIPKSEFEAFIGELTPPEGGAEATNTP